MGTGSGGVSSARVAARPSCGSDTSRKILLKCVGEHQQPMAQLRGFGGRTFRQRLKHRKQSY